MLKKNEQLANVLHKLEMQAASRINIANTVYYDPNCMLINENWKPKEPLHENTDVSQPNTLKMYQERIEILKSRLHKKKNIIIKLELDFVKLKSQLESLTLKSPSRKSHNDTKKHQILSELKQKLNFKAPTPAISHSPAPTHTTKPKHLRSTQKSVNPPSGSSFSTHTRSFSSKPKKHSLSILAI